MPIILTVYQIQHDNNNDKIEIIYQPALEVNEVYHYSC